MVTLDSLQTGKNCILGGLAGGRTFMSRITAMGFIPETRVSVVSNRGYGPLIVYLRDTEVALGRGEAAKIRVREVIE
jgi:ferrous iron transport protein A